jgi:hypothetical protein
MKVMTGDVTLTPLPQTGTPFTSTGDMKSGNITLTFAQATTVKFDPSEPNDPELQKFRAVEVPLANAPPYFDSALKIEVLYGLGPVNAALTPAAKLTVPNTKMWAANAVVEFFLNGMDTFDAVVPAPYGKFGPIGTGKVHNFVDIRAANRSRFARRPSRIKCRNETIVGTRTPRSTSPISTSFSTSISHR